MKYPIYLLAVAIFISRLSANAQKTDGIEYIVNAGEYKLSLPERSFFNDSKLPFKKIVVYDYRFDSSKIGYLETGTGLSYNNKIQLKENWSIVLNNYFKENLDNSSESTLVVFIKSFWMQEGIIDEITTKKVIRKPAFTNSDASGNCKAQLDVYIQSDSTLQPFFQIDGSFLNFYKFKPNKLGEWFYLPFDSMAQKIIPADIASLVAKKKKLTFNEVISYYNKRFDLPILKTDLLTKGIYITFEDFKNNKPLVTDFRLEKGKLTDELYVGQNGNETLLTDYWGFSDGKDIFMKVGFNIYKSIRQQNSFEVFGGKHISNHHNNSSPNDLIKINYMSVDRKILHLNMETGRFN